MKLNMWMIANRLANYEIEMKIDADAEPVLNSTLPYSVPGCVYISAVGQDVLCESVQGYIRIRELGLGDGYLLIQGIFDWYQDWVDKTNDAIMSADFGRLVQLCQQAFGNPVMLQDSNYCLLGMAGPFGEGGMPPEWEYIRKNGQSSVEGYECMSQALQYAEKVYRQNVRQFKRNPHALVPNGGLHATITFHGRGYEKLTVLESTRKINRGDICLLEYISRRMAIYAAAVSGETRKFLDNEVLEDLAAGGTVPREKIRYFQSVIENGRPGKFAVMLVDFFDRARRGDLRALQLLKNIVYRQYPAVNSLIVKGKLLLLLYSGHPEILAEQILKSIGKCGYQKDLQAGLSCEFYDLSELRFFFEQAMQAKSASTGGVAGFYDMAVDYLLENTGLQRLCACEPTLRRMWNEGGDRRMGVLTLKAYLGEERSSKRASEKLFIHKNTLTYRIKYLKESTGWDLENTYIRDYLRLSAYFLEKSEIAKNKN